MLVSVPNETQLGHECSGHHGALAKRFVFLMFWGAARLQTVRNVQQNLEAPLPGKLMSFRPTAYA